MSLAVARPWAIAAVVVGLGWLLGLLMWDTGDMAADFAEIPFHLESVLLPLLVAILAAGADVEEASLRESWCPRTDSNRRRQP